MKSHRQSDPPFGVTIGLVAGMFVGAGLAIWLAPRLASERRQHITESAKRIGRRRSNHYGQVCNRFGEAVEALTSPRAL